MDVKLVSKNFNSDLPQWRSHPEVVEEFPPPALVLLNMFLGMELMMFFFIDILSKGRAKTLNVTHSLREAGEELDLLRYHFKCLLLI